MFKHETLYFETLSRVGMHVFHINSTVRVPRSSCLGGYLSVPDDYPLVLGCEEHVSSSCVFVALVVRALERYSKDPGSSNGGDACFSHQ